MAICQDCKKPPGPPGDKHCCQCYGGDVPEYDGLKRNQVGLQFRVVGTSDVTLIAKTSYLDDEIEKWCRGRGITYRTDAVQDGDALSEFAGRVCYLSLNAERRRKSGEGQNKAYLDHIKEVGHGSVMEHTYWSFLIDDFSKNCTQELVRHRVGVAYSVQSSRYVDPFTGEKYFGNSGHQCGVYIPPEVQNDETLFEEWIRVWKEIVVVYLATFNKLNSIGKMESKQARSIARHILPGGVCNALVFTVNARELNHIFGMRANLFADDEIRRMVMRIWDHVKDCTMFDHWVEREDVKRGRYLEKKV